MKRILFCCLCLGVLMNSILQADMTGTTREPDFRAIYKTVNGRSLWLHCFEPRNAASSERPVILLVHGGGWTRGYPAIFFPMAERLSAMGFVVACVEYRLLDTHQHGASVFDAVADVQDAMSYLRMDSARLRIDPNRIDIAGASAGGHLAIGTALFEDYREVNRSASFRPDAVILFNPVIDTSEAGYGHAKLGSDWQTLSPLHRVHSKMPPTLLFHGQADGTVPFAGARAFQASMLAHGNTCDFFPNQNGNHGYYRKSPVYEETLDTVYAFALRQGLLAKL
ncbi:MAG TPA: alpha/beta hydrolase [Opitutae bacterium]|nr:alpha/beta hydrolase [Opitutae bacterium]